MESPVGARGQIHWRDLVFNLPLVFGTLILLVLFLVVLFGPLWAPVNPYLGGQHIVTHFDSEKGVWISPPLEPSPEYPLGTDEWGNDILSLLLYGARNTLVACTFIAMARILIGLFLGALAGWNEGGLSDQLVMGAVGVVTSVPILISSMLMIYALDIRRGLPVFIIALSLLGWTEIAQYIRSEFLVLRKMPYIGGARAVGAQGFAIAVRHVLPNLLPQVLVITFLEIGAVLMLLGELAFIGVFIGGGSRIALGDELTGSQVVTLSEVPEWGAMLAEGYRWLRARPFIVFPPAFAFFIAVVGFNAFGEGLRRLMDKYHVNTNFLLRKRMVLVIASLTFATIFIINNTGPAPWFARVARAFDGGAAYSYLQDLAGMQGRGAGQPGGEQAADYIAARFVEYGLDPGWRRSSYIYPLEVWLAEPTSQPELTVFDLQGVELHSFRHRLDFGFVTRGHAGAGVASGPLTFVAFTGGPVDLDWEVYRGLDLRGQIVLLLEGNAPASFVTEAAIRGAQGVLWITAGEPDAIPSQVQLGDLGTHLVQPTLPVFRLAPLAARELLGGANTTLDDLLLPGPAFASGPGWFTRQIPARVQMKLELDSPRKVDVPAVLGFLPGSDFELAGELVVLVANYDGLGVDPDGTVFPAVNDNASAVSLLLELARLWQAQELEPRRSVLFVAWGGGRLENPGARAFLENAQSFRHLPNPAPGTTLAPAVVFQLEGAGAGDSPLFIHPASDHRLARLLEGVANGLGVSTVAEVDTSETSFELLRLPRADWVYFGWANSEIAPDQDDLARIDEEKLERMGQMLSLALTTIVRESSY